jgi:hypothetical protein
MAIKADELMSMVESLPIEIKTKLIEKIFCTACIQLKKK